MQTAVIRTVPRGCAHSVVRRSALHKMLPASVSVSSVCHPHQRGALRLSACSLHTSSRTMASSSSTPAKAEEATPLPPKKEEPEKPEESSAMTPPQLVQALDKFIIGQADAKKAMASAIRYRWRRKQLDESQRADCTPRNILMVGPTGCGKTEIARRLAKIIDAPFVIAEATKFTEVGFHGRDIETVVRDLMEAGIKMQQRKLEEEYEPLALQIVEEKILDALLGELQHDADKQTWLGHLRKGWVDDRTVYVEVPVASQPLGMMGGPAGFPEVGGAGFDERGGDGKNWTTASLRAKGEKGKVTMTKLTIKEARKRLLRAELDARITQEEVVSRAIRSTEDEGMIFLDEIDKIVSPKGSYGPDASSEGVQRDLLPIIEGTTVSTKYGNIKSDHILFVCAGSFHAVRPSDMLAELQGRLPIRMQLHSLTEGDFFRILTEPEFGIIKQNVALLATEGLEVVWTECGIREVCRFATEMNTYIENIGARRLHTVVERITSDLSFNAAERSGERVEIDKAFVVGKLSDIEIDKTTRGLL